MPRRDTPHRLVLMLLHSLDGYARQITEGILEYARDRGDWELMIVEPGNLARMIGKANGVIGYQSEVQAALKQAGRVKTPCVGLLNDPSSTWRYPQVTNDERRIGRMAVEHLKGAQLRHVAFSDHLGAPSLRHREFRSAALTAGLGFSGFPEGNELWDMPADQRFRRLDAWLKGLPKPVGVFAFRVQEAHTVSLACRRLRLRVPEDVAILSCNGDDVDCHLTTPPLSCVDLSGEELGRQAAQLLQRLMNGEADLPKQVLIPPARVIRRRSTDTLAVDDPTVERAMRIILREACDGLTPAGLAQIVGHRRETLERMFKREVGHGIHREILAARIDRAKRLLRRSALSLSAISGQCGFSAPPRFTEAFKREVGVTPSEFRREHSGTTRPH